jgi:CheY-like chemotaxis protein
VSRLETGQIELRLEQINLNEVMDEVFLFFREGTKFKDRPVNLKVNKALSFEDAYVEADKGRFTQILYNLVYNAYKFTAEGSIQFGYELKSKNLLLFYVKDTGIGIPENARKVVFERFRQADDSTTRIYGGTGLGLTISKGLVSAMGGNIWFDSEVGKGTNFFFELPLKYFTIAKTKTTKTDWSDMKWNEKSVLIAEDEISNFILLQHILVKTGIHITHVTSGTEIIEKINEGGKCDLLLLDIKMPGMSGIEALKKLRGLNIRIPAIAQTAYAMADDKQKCLDAGFNDYITKPIRPTELLQKMQVFLDK